MNAVARPPQNARGGNSSDTGDEIIIYGLALAFLALGLAAFAIVISNAASVINSMVGEDTGAILLLYLDTYGILLPVITLGIGLYLVSLGLRLFRRDVRAASWARQLLLWLIIASAVLVVQSFGAAPDAGTGLTWALPWLVVVALAALGWWWLGNHMESFQGSETLGESSSRSAWNLLLPTIIVLVIVALRPLEKTFVASLTNARFATADPVRFVGFENYARLLGFRIDSIPCQKDENDACVLDGTGSIVFTRGRDVLDDNYTDMRFREVGGLNLGQNRLIISARDREFVESISNTLVFTLFSVTLELTLGLFIALVINSKFSGRGLMRAAMLVPWAIPTVVSARLWQIMLRDNSSGVINSLLLNIGVIGQSQAWLAKTELQMPAIVAIDVWKTTPFMALVLLAGLQVIPSDLYEAADVDGASPMRQFFSLTLPLLRPAIAIALVFRTLDAIRVFDVFQVLFSRARLSMATYNYDQLVNAQELGYSSAVGVLIFVIILIFTVIYVRILRINEE